MSRRGGLGFADSRLRTRPFLVRRGLCGDHLQEATAPESVPIDPSSAPLPSIHGDVPTLPYFGSLLNDLESPGGLYAAASAVARTVGTHKELIMMATGPDKTSVQMSNNSLVSLGRLGLRPHVMHV